MLAMHGISELVYHYCLAAPTTIPVRQEHSAWAYVNAAAFSAKRRPIILIIESHQRPDLYIFCVIIAFLALGISLLNITK